MQTRLLFALAACTAAVSVGFAQNEPTEDFATAKAHHVARLQQELACVQAATSFDTLRACRPAPGGRGGPPPGTSH